MSPQAPQPRSTEPTPVAADMPGIAPGAPTKTGPTDGSATATDDIDTQQVMEMKKLVALILLVAIGGLSACNTIEGAGTDIQSGGDAVSDAARDVKKEM
jgi:predicted small secreted protein